MESNADRADRARETEQPGLCYLTLMRLVIFQSRSTYIRTVFQEWWLCDSALMQEIYREDAQ